MDAPDILEEILAHHGVKGQKWGVRKARNRSSDVSVVDKKKRLKTYGGAGHPAHSDAVSARTSGQIARKSGTKALSNEQLKAFNERLNLEQNYKRLSYHDKSPPRKFVAKVLGQTGQQQVQESANAVASKQVKKLLVRSALV